MFHLCRGKCSKTYWKCLIVHPLEPSTGVLFLRLSCRKLFSAFWETWATFPLIDQLRGEREPRHADARSLRPRSAQNCQMSLSSFGNLSASGATTLLAPDCSSALGLYVPSVCLFFFTTQRSQATTARTMARTPRMTVGTTIATILVGCKWTNWNWIILKAAGHHACH